MSLGLDHNNLSNNTPQHSSHRQFKDNGDGDDGSTSLLSFQKIKDERDYDRRSYSRKRSPSYEESKFLRTSSPDRGGGGGKSSFRLDDDHAYNDKKYSKESGSSESESTISYIDYNDSFIDKKRRSNINSGQKHGSGRSIRPPSAGDRRLGSTVRTDIRAGSTATVSTITFDYYNRYNQSKSHPRQPQQQPQQHPQQPFVGHDGKSVNHAKYRSEDDYSTMSKPQVPIDITVPSPNKFVQKTSMNTHHQHQQRTYSGRELKKPPYSSSSKVHVHEMGSRRHVSKRPSSSKSRASPRGSDRDKASRSSSRNSRSSNTSKRSRSSDGKRSSSSKSTKSRRSKDSSKSGSSNGRSKSRSRNRSDDDKHRSRRRDSKRVRSPRHLESNDHSDQRSVKSNASDKERRQRDRRRDMMTGRATKHLLDDDKSTNSRSSKSTYSRSSVRYDVDDDGFCMHHPEIELMRLKSDGFWSTVRKKCPECIYEDCPSLLGDIGVDENDETQDDDNHRSSPVPASNDESTAARAILNSTRLFSFHNIMSPEDIEKEEELRRLKRRLAARAYHFPGNTWWQDWMQYLSNTHTVLGLFFHQ